MELKENFHHGKYYILNRKELLSFFYNKKELLIFFAKAVKKKPVTYATVLHI